MFEVSAPERRLVSSRKKKNSGYCTILSTINDENEVVGAISGPRNACGFCFMLSSDTVLRAFRSFVSRRFLFEGQWWRWCRRLRGWVVISWRSSFCLEIYWPFLPLILRLLSDRQFQGLSRGMWLPSRRTSSEMHLDTHESFKPASIRVWTQRNHWWHSCSRRWRISGYNWKVRRTERYNKGEATASADETQIRTVEELPCRSCTSSCQNLFPLWEDLQYC